ncbi:MAG: GNAT family N-acetyltransferase [Actinomycetota bacterium]|nr:GNAT family N-acetyltransferase [Actinomycetota bacterium]
MRTSDRDEVIATRGAVRVHLLAASGDIGTAIALLDEAESRLEAPLVDEAERDRLQALAAGEEEPKPHWHSLLARRGAVPSGYAGIVLPTGKGEAASADLAIHRAVEPCADTIFALFEALRELTARHGVNMLVVWIRHARDDDVASARTVGLGVHRRLLVLGRHLSSLPDPTLPPGMIVRPYRPDADDEAVVAVLRAAFEGSADADWDHARLEQRRSFAWFDAADLLLAEDAQGGIPALHWTKRRGGGVGEVYVLAVAPEAQGSGLGRGLLRAGLHHLRDRGCRDVLLWVDEDNAPAVNLYRSQGFSTRWIDVAFEAKL